MPSCRSVGASSSAAGRIANGILGGWSISGLWRWSTGYPFSAFSPEWPTNYNLESLAVLSGKMPTTGSFIVPQVSGGTGPNVFKDPGITDPTNPNAAINQMRSAFPGEKGDRNIFRGPGTFNIDAGVMKLWPITESQSVKLTWQVFTSPTPRASMWGR